MSIPIRGKVRKVHAHTADDQVVAVFALDALLLLQQTRALLGNLVDGDDDARALIARINGLIEP